MLEGIFYTLLWQVTSATIHKIYINIYFSNY